MSLPRQNIFASELNLLAQKIDKESESKSKIDDISWILDNIEKLHSIERGQIYSIYRDTEDKVIREEPGLSFTMPSLAPALDYPINSSLQTVLMVACSKKGNAPLVNELLARGGSVDVKDQNGRTALFYAAAFGDEEMVSRLITAGAQQDLADVYRYTPLVRACIARNKAGVKTLLTHLKKEAINRELPWTALGEAAKSQDRDITEMLIDAGAKLNIQDGDGNTALFLSCLTFEPSSVFDLLMTKLREKGELNLINMPNKKGRTPLFAAASSGNISAMHELITSGASIDVKEKRHRTAFRYALVEHHFSAAVFLIKAGANPNQDIRNSPLPNVALLKPLDFAIKQPDLSSENRALLVRTLILHGGTTTVDDGHLERLLEFFISDSDKFTYQYLRRKHALSAGYGLRYAWRYDIHQHKPPRSALGLLCLGEMQEEQNKFYEAAISYQNAVFHGNTEGLTEISDEKVISLRKWINVMSKISPDLSTSQFSSSSQSSTAFISQHMAPYQKLFYSLRDLIVLAVESGAILSRKEWLFVINHVHNNPPKPLLEVESKETKIEKENYSLKNKQEQLNAHAKFLQFAMAQLQKSACTAEEVKETKELGLRVLRADLSTTPITASSSVSFSSTSSSSSSSSFSEQKYGETKRVPPPLTIPPPAPPATPPPPRRWAPLAVSSGP